MLRTIKKLIPEPVFLFFQPAYHFLLAWAGALAYGRPARKIFVVGITGTKGKTTVAEIVNAILEADGRKTALIGTLRVKVGDDSERNMFKMTMPGRFFIQKFLARAVAEGCTHAVVEMTSEGAKQYRHKFLYMDALIVTNISPEHIESHGSYEKYLDAKLSIARELARNGKGRKILVVNADDKESLKFLSIKGAEPVRYSLDEMRPFEKTDIGTSVTLFGEPTTVRLPGEFNLYNILAASAFARSIGVSREIIRDVAENFSFVPGRVERIDEGQDFSVIVDYAHTPDSLEKVYRVFGGARKICVLGGTGGGRDRWKRKEMGSIADKECAEIILTNEDPYDEDPEGIVRDIALGITRVSPTVIMDRGQAIYKAVAMARAGDAVLITGKGTDPYIMEADGKKTPWSDADTARRALADIMKEKKKSDRPTGARKRG